MRSLCFMFFLLFLKVVNGNEGVCEISQQRCNCKFYGDDETGTTKSDYLAGTAGALTPVVLTLVTTAVWQFVKKLRSENIANDKKSYPKEPDNFKHKSLLSSVANESNHGDNSRRGSTDSGFVGYSRRGSMVSPLSLTDQEIYVDDDSFDNSSKTDIPMKAFNRNTEDGRIQTKTYNAWVQPQHRVVSSVSAPSGGDNINKWLEF